MKLSRDLLLFALLAAITVTSYTQSPAHSASPTSSSSSPPINAMLLAGLQDIPTGSKGSIELTPDSFIFVGSGLTTRLTRRRISAVFVGEERVETGGVAGKIARIAIPFGGGAALGTMTQKQVGLLTIEYRDEHDGLRSAVFVLPRAKALDIEEKIDLSLLAHPLTVSPRVCNGSSHNASNSIRVMAAQSAPEVVLTPEYRALLYERLVETPPQKFHVDRVLRDGERGAECANYSLALTVVGFSKGNAALRASTGPVGLFVGATKLAVRVQLRSQSGRVVLDKEIRASRRGDSESLNAAASEAREIAEQIEKANTHIKRIRQG